MDGVGGGIKRVVRDVIPYNPNGVVRNTEQLMDYLPITPNIVIETYEQDDVGQVQKLYPENFGSVNIVSQDIDISKVHEVFCRKEDNKKVQWKALSDDEIFINAQWMPLGKKEESKKHWSIQQHFVFLKSVQTAVCVVVTDKWNTYTLRHLF